MSRTNENLYTSDLIHNDLISTYGFEINKMFSSRMKYILLEKYIKNKDSVLDAGCANGLFVFAISHLCESVQGIDINQNFIDLALQKKRDMQLDNASFQFGDLENIPFYDNLFDLAYCYSVMVLVNDFSKSLSEVSRIVKKNGFLILDITGKYNLSGRFWRKFYISKGHFSFNALSWDHLERLCKENDLKIIESHALGFLDQWKYLPFIPRFASKLSFLDRVTHAKKFDLDYAVSNLPFFKTFASRWYVVCQKM